MQDTELAQVYRMSFEAGLYEHGGSKPGLNVRSILAVLPTLAPGDLERVIGKARALLAFSGTADQAVGVDGPEEHAWLVRGLRVELKRHLLPDDIPWQLISAWGEYKRHFALAAPSVAGWLERMCPDLDRTRRFILAAFAAECLARHIRAFVPLSMQSLMKFYSLTPQAIERWFPSYAQNGWLPVLLRAK